MADTPDTVKIADLPELGDPTGDELVPVTLDGITYAATLDALAARAARIPASAGLVPVGLFVDNFDRPDGRLGGDWIDGHDLYPSTFEPLGIYDERVVVVDPKTRPGTYDTVPPSGHPPTLGRLHPGIGCAWRPTGSRSVRVKVRWSGDIGIAEGTHVEATPLLHITPGTGRFGFGCWLSELTEGLPLIVAGYIGFPPEDFPDYVVAVHAMSHVDGTERDFELVSDGESVQAFLDGTLLTAWSEGLGDTLPLHDSVKFSRLHGFAVDAHYSTPALTPTLPALTSCEIEPLDNLGWLSSSAGGTIAGDVAVDASVTVTPGASGHVAIVADGADGPALHIYADESHANPIVAIGEVIGTGVVAFGPGGASPADVSLSRSSSGAAHDIAVGGGEAAIIAGGRRTVNAITATGYAVVFADRNKLITRSNASASTQTWPSDATADIPVGSELVVANIGAGTVTHSAGSGASLVTGSTTAHTQGKIIRALKVAANTWCLT